MADAAESLWKALNHCHVGPDHTANPEIRVPMPPMKPWEALDRVLSQVVPDWEPAPWGDVTPDNRGEG